MISEIFRISCPKVFCKKSVSGTLLKNETPAQFFYCEVCEILKKTYFLGHLHTLIVELFISINFIDQNISQISVHIRYTLIQMKSCMK